MHTQQKEAREELLKKTDHELRAMLMQELALDDMDIEYVNCISDILAERHPEQYDFDDTGILEAVFQICEEDEAERRQEEKKRKAAERRKRVPRMLATAAVLAILITSVMIVPVHGTNLWQLLIGWTSELFSMNAGELGKVGNDNLTFKPSEDSLAFYDYLIEKGVTVQIAPKLFPEEYHINSLQELGYADGVEKYSAEYISSDNSKITLNIRNYEEPVSVTESDHQNEYLPYLSGGVEHIVFKNSNSTIVTWTSDGYYGVMTIYSDTITISEIHLMIDSIYS